MVWLLISLISFLLFFPLVMSIFMFSLFLKNARSTSTSGLCIWHILCLECASPDIHMASSLSFFSFFFYSELSCLIIVPITPLSLHICPLSSIISFSSNLFTNALYILLICFIDRAPTKMVFCSRQVIEPIIWFQSILEMLLKEDKSDFDYSITVFSRLLSWRAVIL